MEPEVVQCSSNQRLLELMQQRAAALDVAAAHSRRNTELESLRVEARQLLGGMAAELRWFATHYRGLEVAAYDEMMSLVEQADKLIERMADQK